MAFVDLVVGFGGEDASYCGDNSEGLEIIAGDEFCGDALRGSVERDVGRCVEAAEYGFKGVGAALEILVHGVGGGARTGVVAEVRGGGPDHDETGGVFDGEQAEDELVEECEDGCVCSDAQGKREDRYGGE
jgi:hypothetical protein